MPYIRNIIFTTLIIIAPFFAEAQMPDNSLAVTDSIIQKFNSDYENSTKMMDLDLQVQEQKMYKYLFLATTVFFILFNILLFLFFYKRIGKIQSLTQINLREIQLRDLRIKNLTTLLGYSAQPMMLMNKEGDVKWINSAFAQYKYFAEDSKLEDNNYYTDIMADELEKQSFKKVKETNEPQNFDLNVKGINVSRIIIPIIEEDGEPSGYAIIDYVKK